MDRKEMTDEEFEKEKEKVSKTFAKVNDMILRDDQRVLDRIGRIRKQNLTGETAIILETLTLCLVRDPYPLINEILDILEHKSRFLP